MLKLNSSNEGYYTQILHAHGVDTADPTNIPRAIEILEKYEEVLPRSNTHLRLAIDLLEAGDVFKAKLLKYMRPLILKGAPSLVNDLQALYENKDKAQILGDVFHSMNQSMEETMCLHPDDEEEQDPTV